MEYNPDREEVFKRIGMGWHPVPNIRFKFMKMDEQRLVPNSFHKFFDVLWHEIFFNRGRRKADWTAEKYMEQFHMRPADAAKWSAAFQESRLFKVRKVRPREVESKEPITIFTYNVHCTSTDWLGFYRGLMAACKEVAGKKFPGIPEWRAIVRRHVESETEALISEEGGVRAPFAA